MNIVFTLQEMKDALIKAGYEIKEEEIEVDSYFVGQPPKKVKILAVYKDGVSQCDWAKSRNTAVDHAFNDLLKKKLLELVALQEVTKESYWAHKCTDCNYQGDNFTQECLPDGNSGEFSNYWLCPNCHSHAGQSIEITK